MARLLGYAEDLSESTSTGSTVTKASVTADLVNGTTYALFWSYQAGSDDTTSIGRARCMDATGAASRGLNQFRARDTTDYAWAGNVSIYTAAATASRTFEVDFIRTSGTGTVKIKNVRLLVLELTADDAFGATVGNQTTTSTSFSDATSATFTPSSTGDYLFIASGAITNGNTEIELQTPGGTSVNTITTAIPYSGVYQPWSAVWREDGLAASSQTARLRWRSTSGVTQNMQAACIVALRLDRFHNVQNTQDDTGAGGTDTSYTATESLAATGLAADRRDTIVLASVSVSNDSTADSSYIEFRDGGTQVVEGVHEAASASLRTSAGLIGYKPTSSSASITFDLRRKSESTNTTTVEFASIALFEIPTSFDGSTSSGGITITGQSAAYQSAPLLNAAAGSVLISGQPAEVTTGADLSPATGAVLITGQPAVIETGSPLIVTAATGSVLITGQPATVETTDTFIGAPATGAVTIQGQPVTLIEGQGLEVTPATGAVLITGQPVEVFAGSPGIVDAAAGQVTITGQPVAVRADVVLSPATAEVVIAGQSATVVAETNALLSTGTGSVLVVGKPATITLTSNIVLSPDSCRMTFGGKQAWIETSDLGGTVVVVDPPADRGGQTWREIVMKADPDWPVHYRRSEGVYEFGKRRFDESNPYG